MPSSQAIVQYSEDRLLNGLREAYVSMNIPISTVCFAVNILRITSIDTVSVYIDKREHDAEENFKALVVELTEYFDYVVSSLDAAYSNLDEQSVQRIRSLRNLRSVANKSAEQRKAKIAFGESQTYTEWVEYDSLTQVLQQDEKNDSLLLEESAISFFNSWKQMPPSIKIEIWKEREVMAALYKQMHARWRKIPGFRSIAVGERVVDGKRQTSGILIFDMPVHNEAYQLWNIPRYIEVDFPTELASSSEKLIPIQLEWMSASRDFSKEAILADLADASATKKIFLQSGDLISEYGSTKRLTPKTATLTTFATPQDSTDESDVLLLSVGHGFTDGYNEVEFCGIGEIPHKIGDISFRSEIQKELARKLDVTLIKPTNSIQINPTLKWKSVIPKPPVLVRPGMIVQMYGGVSKHQQGVSFIRKCLT